MTRSFRILKIRSCFLRPGIFVEVFVLGRLEQLRHGHLLQFGDVRAAALDFLVAVVGLLVETAGKIVIVIGRVGQAAAGRLGRRFPDSVALFQDGIGMIFRFRHGWGLLHIAVFFSVPLGAVL